MNELTTARQRKILEAQGTNGEKRDTAPLALGVGRSNISKTNSLIFRTFAEDLDTIIRYYPIFESRALKSPGLYSDLRKLARLVNRERKVETRMPRRPRAL